MTTITEADVEHVALEWLERQGWRRVPRTGIAAGRIAVGAGVR